MVSDIADGFVVANPLYLKSYDAQSLKPLRDSLERFLIDIKKMPFPYNKPDAIRERNLRLQRIYTAMSIINNYARDNKLVLEEQKKQARKMIRYF